MHISRSVKHNKSKRNNGGTLKQFGPVFSNKKSENQATRAIFNACHFAAKLAVLSICRAMFLQLAFQFGFLNTVETLSFFSLVGSLVRNSFYTVKNLLVCWFPHRYITLFSQKSALLLCLTNTFKISSFCYIRVCFSLIFLLI